MDKSFSFNTSYASYFNEKEINGDGNYISIDKIYNMGKFISMDSNERINNINVLFEVFNGLSGVIGSKLRCRMKKSSIVEAYYILKEESIEICLEILLDKAKEQILDLYDSQKDPDYNEMNSLVAKCENIVNNGKTNTMKKYEKLNKESRKRFIDLITSFSRPIVGIYDAYNDRFEIVNADQMYMNGENSVRQIKLQKITKNSPVALAFELVGTMSATMGYLAYRNHKVNLIEEDIDSNNIPVDKEHALSNIIANEDNSIVTEAESIELDESIMVIALDTYDKLDLITEKKKVYVELSLSVDE